MSPQAYPFPEPCSDGCPHATATAEVDRSLRVPTGLTEGQIERIKGIRAIAAIFAGELTHSVNPGRERSLAITKVEEAAMWATKGIQLENQPLFPAPEPPSGPGWAEKVPPYEDT